MGCHVRSCGPPEMSCFVMGTGGTLCDVSCDVMICMRPASYATAVSGMKSVLGPPSLAREGRGGPSRSGRALPRCAAAGPSPDLPRERGEETVLQRHGRPVEAVFVCLPHVVPSSRFVPLRSVLPAAGFPKRRDPNSRVMRAGVRARGRAFAPARFARLIARAHPCARARRRAHLARWPNRGLFSAPARREAASDASSFLPLHISLNLKIQVVICNFSVIMNKYHIHRRDRLGGRVRLPPGVREA